MFIILFEVSDTTQYNGSFEIWYYNSVLVIEVPNMTKPIDSDSFKFTMEYRLASVYNLAMNTYRSLLPRTRRAATDGNATIQVTRQYR